MGGDHLTVQLDLHDAKLQRGHQIGLEINRELEPVGGTSGDNSDDEERSAHVPRIREIGRSSPLFRGLGSWTKSKYEALRLTTYDKFRRLLSVPEQIPKPTPAELQILEIIWDIGLATVRQVHAKLSQVQPTGHTTVLKLMQIMHRKGLVVRDESSRSHVYEAAQPREQTRGKLVRDLIDRAFSGSAAGLVSSALAEKVATPAELAEIRALLDRLEGES